MSPSTSSPNAMTFLAMPEEVRDWRMVVLYAAAAEAGVLDALPGTPAEIATGLGLHPEGVRVVLDALCVWGIVETDAGGQFRRGDDAPSIDDGLVIRHHARAIRRWSTAVGDLVTAGGSPSTEATASSAARGGPFLDALAVNARHTGPPVVDACLYAAPNAKSVLDLGGGHGEHALEFARRGVRVVMQDRPEVLEVPGRRERLEAGGVELFAGNFFETLPDERFDLIFCSGVVATMDDDRNRLLYRRLEPVLADRGFLAISTILRARHPLARLFAVQMMVNGNGGDTHSEDEVRTWLTDAGLPDIVVTDLEDGRRSLIFARRRA